MDCRTFETMLADFQQGSLSPGESVDAERHLAECAACRILADIAGGRLNLLHPAEQQSLTRSILERSSGQACGRVHLLLCDFVDGELAEFETALVRQHLENCSGCHSLAMNLVQLAEILPSLGGIQPEPAVFEAVLQATVAHHRFTAGPRTLFLAWWNRLLQRPRFSFEAAYIGTLALVFIVGNPFPAMRALSVHSVEALSRIVPAGVGEGHPGVIQSVKGMAVDFSEHENSLRQSLENARLRGEIVVSGSLQVQARSMREYWTRSSGAVRFFWRSLWSGDWKHRKAERRQ